MAKQNESLDVSAKTIDEAIEQGLAQLGLTREQVDIEIIKEGKRGVFGIGAEEAQIRLTPRPQTPVASPPPTQSVQSVPAAETEIPQIETAPPAELSPTVPIPARLEKDTDLEPEAETKAAPAQYREVGEIGVGYLKGLLERMGITAQVTYRIAPDLVEVGEEPPLVLDVTGDDLGILIGRRSETLQALQYMVRVMVSKETNTWHPLMVDVESYRVRRRQSLRQMAEKMAERVATTRKKVVLEAMPAHERRIIHIALKSHPAVLTKSVGSEDSRKVTIIPK